MQPAEARAKLSSVSEVETPVSVTIPRADVEEALRAHDDAPDLVLDVLRRTTGDPERRSVAVEWDRSDLETLLAESGGDEITLTLDANALNGAFEDVEAHGVRQTVVVLAAVVAGATAGAAAAGPADSIDVQLAQAPSAMASEYSALEAQRGAEAASAGIVTPAEWRAAEEAPAPGAEVASPDIVAGGYGEPAAYGSPRPTPADYVTPATPGTVASPDVVSGGYEEPAAEYGSPRPTPADYVTPATPGTVASPDAVSGGYGGQAEYGAPRAMPSDYPVADTGGGSGINVDVPATAWAALAGGIALAIAGAAFIGRGRRLQPS